MKHVLCSLAVVVLLMLTACDKTVPSKKLFSKDLAAQHPEWKKLNDTTKVDTIFEFEGLKVPVTFSWTTANDMDGCLHIAYLEMKQREGESGGEILGLKEASIPCGMKFESQDTRRFETIILTGKFNGRKGIKKYNYNGPFITIRGNGEYIFHDGSFKE